MTIKRLALISLSMLLSAGVAAAQPGRSAATAAVLALEDTLNAAWLRHDTLAVLGLIADDFRGITQRGRTIGRADMLRAVARAEETATDVNDRTARALGPNSDVVVTTAKIIDRGRRANGQAFSVATLVTNVWVRRRARWRLAASHESAAP